MGAVAEPLLYSHLLAEACVAIPGLAIAGHLTVTPDGGRYKKARSEHIREHVTQSVTLRHPRAKVNLGFGDSAALPGLQVADVIANSVFLSLGATEAAEASRSLLAALTARGQLTIQDVQLQGVCPGWLAEA